MWKIARVINCYNTSLQEELTAIYLHSGFLKIMNVYFVVNIDEQMLL